jgi:hypothetical protein
MGVPVLVASTRIVQGRPSAPGPTVVPAGGVP